MSKDALLNMKWTDNFDIRQEAPRVRVRPRAAEAHDAG